MLEPLNDTEWRVFRLLIRDLPDRELEAVEQQLQREMIHRQECDSSWARLFFTSLSAVDLQRAGSPPLRAWPIPYRLHYYGELRLWP